MTDSFQNPTPLQPLPFATRFWFAYLAFFKVLFDGVFAARVRQVEQLPPGALPPPALAAKPEEASPPAPPAFPPPAAPSEARPAPAPVPAAPSADDGALTLLALLQRDGRLLDFLEQEIAGFGDADIGAAVRVVHEGCRRALREHVTLEPVRAEEEGARVTIAAAAPQEITLTGNVGGKGPYIGTLRHRGWRATAVTMPEPVPGHDARVLAAAEVEL